MKLGWKTISGGLLAAFGYLSQPDVLAVLPHRVASVVTGLGVILGVIGVRAAISKVSPISL